MLKRYLVRGITQRNFQQEGRDAYRKEVDAVCDQLYWKSGQQIVAYVKSMAPEVMVYLLISGDVDNPHQIMIDIVGRLGVNVRDVTARQIGYAEYDKGVGGHGYSGQKLFQEQRHSVDLVLLDLEMSQRREVRVALGRWLGDEIYEHD